MKNLLQILSAAVVLCASCADQSSNPTTTSTAMEETVLGSIMSRTSVRSYDGRPVEADKIEKMLRAGMAAPTAMNKQPWHFVVVNDKQQLGALSAANPRARMLENAPLAIVVCGDMQKAVDGDGRQFWIQDCSAATENILLAAHAQGLGAVWTALYPFAERYEPVVEALGLPSYIVPLCTIVIGYPDAPVQPKDKYDAANVSYNTFGGK